MTQTRRPFALAVYGLATRLAEPFAPWLLSRRAKRGKEDPARLGERLGRASAARPEGALIWLHGASVGESLSLLPLIDRFRAERPQAALLVTSGTLTSATLLARRLPPGVIHQYVPIDAPGAVARFLGHWRPDLAIFAESELWPNLILGARDAGCRLALVSAKVSEASARGWARQPAAARAVLGAYQLVLAQDARSAARLAELGRPAEGLIDLKYGADPLPYDDDGLAAFRARSGHRTVFLAASTHPGEDALVLDAFTASGEAGRALLVIAPRHPERAADIMALCLARGLSAARRSLDDPPAMARVYVADTLGEMGLWLRAARLAFVGGSLVPGVGGHNPLEPARLGCPAASGPHVANWQSVYDDLGEAGGVEIVDGSAPLAALFDRPDEALSAMAARAAERVALRDEEVRTGLARILELAP